MSHGHDHSHVGDSAAPGHRRRIAIALGVTATILVAQAVGALLTGSLALLTDTAHMLTDAGGLAVALVAATLMARPPTERLTWGFRRVEVLAALTQAAVLLAVGVYAAVEGVRRLWAPPEIAPTELLVFGVVGLVGNMVAIAVLASGRDANLNMRAAFLEVVNDALGSVGVIVAAIVIRTTGWLQADALAGLLIAALIVPRAVTILREAGGILLEQTPRGLDLGEVREHMLGVDHVVDVHDLHASTVATGLPVISAHVVVDDECFQTGHAPEILQRLAECVATHFPVALEHSTFQIETAEHAAQETHRHG